MAGWPVIRGALGRAVSGVLSDAKQCQYVPVRIRWPSPATVLRRPRPAFRVGFVAIVAVALLGAAACQGYGVVASEGTVATSAGTIAVQCIDRVKVKIVGAEPAAGFTANIIVEGPAGQASLVFENPNANDFRVAVHCDSGVPGFQEFEIEDTTLTD